MDKCTAAFRRGLIARVHMARENMRLDEETYRGLLASVTGYRSAGKCTVPQLKAVLAEMRAKGWMPSPRVCRAASGRPAAIHAALRPLHAKITALCADLKRPLSYAEAIITRQTKNSATLGTADRVQLTACVSALVRQQSREGKQDA